MIDICRICNNVADVTKINEIYICGRCKYEMENDLMFACHYSDESMNFWRLVNAYGDKDSSLYKLSCDLRDLEKEVLELLQKEIKQIENNYDSRISM